MVEFEVEAERVDPLYLDVGDLVEHGKVYIGGGDDFCFSQRLGL